MKNDDLPRTERVIVCSIYSYEMAWPFGEKGTPLTGMIEWMQSKLQTVPEQHRKNAKICMAAMTAYRIADSGHATITIWYDITESPADVAARIEQRERALLACLQKKYQSP